MFSLFECNAYSWWLSSLEEIKLILIVNWILYDSDFLRPLMSFNYGLILSIFSSNDKF